MNPRYSYNWYIQQFEQAKNTAEAFLLAVDEAQFFQPPAENKWCIAECYSHLINFGNIYYQPIAEGLSKTNQITAQDKATFPPRWIWKKAAHFFEPPYSIKITTFSSMEPDSITGYNRLELLEEFLSLQDRFITQLERAQNKYLDLNEIKRPHPIFSFLKLRCSEYLLLTLAHQRRHQWQAEQTLSALNPPSNRLT